MHICAFSRAIQAVRCTKDPTPRINGQCLATAKSFYGLTSAFGASFHKNGIQVGFGRLVALCDRSPWLHQT